MVLAVREPDCRDCTKPCLARMDVFPCWICMLLCKLVSGNRMWLLFVEHGLNGDQGVVKVPEELCFWEVLTRIR